MEHFNVVQLNVSVKCQGEWWEGEAFWSEPKNSLEWAAFRKKVHQSLHAALFNRGLTELPFKLKASGTTYEVRGPEAVSVSLLLQKFPEDSPDRWEFTPLTTYRYTTREGGSNGK